MQPLRPAADLSVTVIARAGERGTGCDTRPLDPQSVGCLARARARRPGVRGTALLLTIALLILGLAALVALVIWPQTLSSSGVEGMVRAVVMVVRWLLAAGVGDRRAVGPLPLCC